MVLAGLWFGRGKPHMPTFLKPIVKSLNYLKDVGRCIHAPGLIYLIVKNCVWIYRHWCTKSDVNSWNHHLCYVWPPSACTGAKHGAVQWDLWLYVLWTTWENCNYSTGRQCARLPIQSWGPRGPRRTHQGCESLAVEATHDKPVSHHPWTACLQIR